MTTTERSHDSSTRLRTRSCTATRTPETLYAYVAALITAGMGGMQAENIALEGLRRSVAALGDLDTVSLLEKSL
jgi:hypothetical protein